MKTRSFSSMPGNRPARFNKACAAGADVVISDLEDAVARDVPRARKVKLNQPLATHLQQTSRSACNALRA